LNLACSAPDTSFGAHYTFPDLLIHIVESICRQKEKLRSNELKELVLSCIQNISVEKWGGVSMLKKGLLSMMQEWMKREGSEGIKHYMASVIKGLLAFVRDAGLDKKVSSKK